MINTEIKGMSKEERAKLFCEHKSDILSLSDLDSVNGGTSDTGEDDAGVRNPGSAETPFEGNWFSSFGYVCDGEEVC